MKKRLHLTLMFACCALVAMAQLRDPSRMKATVRQALLATGERQAATGEPQELRQLSHCSVLGYAGGRFAVVSADGNRVLGISTACSSEGQNPEFEWWLQAANAAMADRASGNASASADVLRPNPKKYPLQVEPMLGTHWGQMDPYNRKCPVDETGERCVSGCMATSMAQVLNYYQAPEHGEGIRTIYYPYQDSIAGTPVTVDFSDVSYRWDLLDVPNFKTDFFTDEQADAVATVMLHCGVATDMRYGVKAAGGSSATPTACANGLRTYLMQPDAQLLFRDGYDDEEWMDVVFGELSTGHPLIYGGQAFTGGHSFVLNGYDRNGLVYVNWGWNGDDEGYYDIGLLNPGGTTFADDQHMLTGLCPTIVLPLAADITVTEAGTLATQLASAQLADYCTLSVSGPMSDADFPALREAVAGYHVSVLDLSQADFESLPERALYGCHELKTLMLPHGLKHLGDGALGDLRYLSHIDLTPGDDADFVVDGDMVYNRERTEIIAVLSTIEGELRIADTVTSIHPYAFAGCVLLKKLDLPATITTLGAETLRNCYWLEELKVRSKSVVTLSGYDVFDGIDKSVCTLYVPSGMKTSYNRRAQWKDFNDMVEFGTTVKANNAVRKVGEANPEFGYSVSGEPVTGVPELYTDATIDSPAGIYTIFVTPGTITAPDVEYVNGHLIVEESDTGIHDVTREESPGAVYDLSGRRLTESQRHGGLYIERTPNGKAVKRLVRK